MENFFLHRFFALDYLIFVLFFFLLLNKLVFVIIILFLDVTVKFSLFEY